MKYLNLTEGFNPYNAKEEDCIKFESFFFNGGEPHIKIKDNLYGVNTNITITSRTTSMNDFMMLMVASEAIFQTGNDGSIFLFIPYFPGGRQDRRMILGEPLTVKVFSEFINRFKWGQVDTFDNHSEVATALVDNSYDLNNHKFVMECLDWITMKRDKPFHLISPDSGANKKIKDLAKYIIGDECYLGTVIKCDKTRNVSNGNITGFEVYADDLEGKDCIIVDDICDGGGTFIGLAKELKKKNAGDIYLIVSHGIFSKPLKELKPYFKKIYTTDSWRSWFSTEKKMRDCTDLVEIVKFKNFM